MGPGSGFERSLREFPAPSLPAGRDKEAGVPVLRPCPLVLETGKEKSSSLLFAEL